MDTLEHPHGFIIKEAHDTFSIVVANGSGYIGFNLIDYENIDSIARVDINGSESNELVIFHSREYNWSHANSGLASTTNYMAIFDLDKSEVIFNEVLGKYENTWGQNENEEEYNNETVMEYSVEFDNKTIRLEINKETLTNPENLVPLIIFELNNNQLVRRPLASGND
jgi:hypothetical protein